MRFLAAALGAAFLFVTHPAGAVGTACFSKARFVSAFEVMAPQAHLRVLSGERAKAYLAAYNRFGRPSALAGSDLLIFTLTDGSAVLVPLENEVGCRTYLAGAKLHRAIMTAIAGRGV